MAERDLVNEALDRAKENARTLAKPDASAPEREAAKAWLHVNLTEAIVRQIRDLDDDVWHVKGTLESSLADLTIAVNGSG